MYFLLGALLAYFLVVRSYGALIDSEVMVFINEKSYYLGCIRNAPQPESVRDACNKAAKQHANNLRNIYKLWDTK